MTLENMRFFLPLLLSNGAADQPDIARPKLRFVRARRLSAAPLPRARSVRGNELAQRRSVCGVRWSALLGVSS